MFEYAKSAIERSTDINELIEVLVFHSGNLEYKEKCDLIFQAQAKAKTLIIF